MKIAIIVIKSSPNALLPLPVEKKVFKWDMDEFDYSEEAFNYIQVLMMQQRAFTVDTSEALDYSNRRMNIVFGTLQPNV